MRLAEIRPNSRIISLSDLGSRDTDQNHDWVNYAKQFYSSNDITRAPDFVHEVSSTSRNAAKGNDNINYETLNENQKKVIKRIESHYNDILTGIQMVPLRIMIMGTVGTGKSYLIRTI